MIKNKTDMLDSLLEKKSVANQTNSLKDELDSSYYGTSTKLAARMEKSDMASTNNFKTNVVVTPKPNLIYDPNYVIVEKEEDKDRTNTLT